MLQVFQLKARVIQWPVTCGEMFIFKLHRLAIAEDEVRGVLLCMQDFVESPYFPQHNFISAMLTESAAICDGVLCIHVVTTSSPQLITDLCSFVDRVVDRRRALRDTKDQWYAAGGASPSVEDSAFRSGVGISKIVEQVQVERVPDSVPFLSVPGPCSLCASSGKEKRWPVVLWCCPWCLRL